MKPVRLEPVAREVKSAPVAILRMLLTGGSAHLIAAWTRGIALPITANKNCNFAVFNVSFRQDT